MAGNITIDVTVNGELIQLQIPPIVGIDIIPNASPFQQLPSDWDSITNPTQILNKPLVPDIANPTAENDVIVGSSTIGSWIVKTIEQFKTILQLGTAAFKNVSPSGNASISEIVMGDDSRLVDTRTPKPHAASHFTTDPIQDATATQKGVATPAQITKLNGIEPLAQVNINADWQSITGDSQILNKPTLGTASSKDIPAVGDAGLTEVVLGSDSRLTDTRVPNNLTGAVTSIGVATTLNSNLNDLNDVVAPSPNLDDFLKFNGLEWVNGSVTTPTSAGSGVSFFYSTALSGISTYELISRSPDGDAETDESISVNNETLPFEDYSTDVALGRTMIDAGIWTFNTYTYVSSSANVSTLIYNVYKRSSGGTETLLFSVETEDINYTSVDLLITSSVQPAFTILATDLLVVKLSAKTTNTSATTIHFVHSGVNHYSNILTPLITLHGDLAGLQGGNATERYHLSLAEAGVVANTSGTNSGDNATNSQYSGLATSKQDALGFTPEDVSNKENLTIDTSTTKYPTVNLLKSGLDLKQNVGSYELSTNKAIVLTTSNDTLYPSVKAVVDALAGKQPAGSYLVASDITGKEDTSNKVISISAGSTDSQYPSAKLVYDQLAGKQPTGSYLTSISGAITTSGSVSSLGSFTTAQLNSALSDNDIATGGGVVTGNSSGNNTGDQNLAPYALLSGKLSQFASTTSSELAGVISDETGSGSLVFGNSPSLSNPSIIGQRRAVVTKTADYLATSTDDIIRFTASGTLSLPPATGSGKIYNPLVDGVGVQLIVDADASETINGSLTITMTNKQSMTICDSASGVWNIL
jgi:hypothetical protein